MDEVIPLTVTFLLFVSFFYFYECLRILKQKVTNSRTTPLTETSRSRYYSTSNNSKMVQDRAILTMVEDH